MAPNISTFSLSHVGVLDGTTAAEVADLYGVNTGSLELDTDSFDRPGDDRILSTVRWINKGTVSFSTHYLPMDMIALLFGTAVVSGAEGYSMQLWTERGMTSSRPRPIVVLAPGEDEEGVPMDIKIVLYRVRFGQPTFDQFASYKQSLGITLEGDALLSDKDELGAEFDDNQGARIGKIVAVYLESEEPEEGTPTP